jgi:hypothetical protein
MKIELLTLHKYNLSEAKTGVEDNQSEVDFGASVFHLTDDSRSRDDVLFSRHETR